MTLPLFHQRFRPSNLAFQVDRPEQPPWVLEGHSGEVSGVAWCQADANQVATCGDDAVVKVWNVNRDAPQLQTAALLVSIVLQGAPCHIVVLTRNTLCDGMGTSLLCVMG